MFRVILDRQECYLLLLNANKQAVSECMRQEAAY